jgi:hypothetical protein
VPHFQEKTIAYALLENKMQLTREEALFENKGGDVHKLPRGPAYESADVSDDTYPDGRIAIEAIARLRGFKKTAEPFFLAIGFLKPHLPFCAPKKYWDLHDPSAFALAERSAPPDGAPSFAPTDWSELRQYREIPEKGGPLSPELQRRLIHGYYAATSYIDAQSAACLTNSNSSDLPRIPSWSFGAITAGTSATTASGLNIPITRRLHAPPLIVADPRKPAAFTVHALVEFVDIYPTLCDPCGSRQTPHLQGVSLVPLINNPVAHGRTAVFQVFPRNTRATGPLLGYAVRTDRWRYVEWRKANDNSVVARELYDMITDPSETTNLADKSEQAEVVSSHGALLAERPRCSSPDGLKLIDLLTTTKPPNKRKPGRKARLTVAASRSRAKFFSIRISRHVPRRRRTGQRAAGKWASKRRQSRLLNNNAKRYSSPDAPHLRDWGALRQCSWCLRYEYDFSEGRATRRGGKGNEAAWASASPRKDLSMFLILDRMDWDSRFRGGLALARIPRLRPPPCSPKAGPPIPSTVSVSSPLREDVEQRDKLLFAMLPAHGIEGLYTNTAGVEAALCPSRCRLHRASNWKLFSATALIDNCDRKVNICRTVEWLPGVAEAPFNVDAEMETSARFQRITKRHPCLSLRRECCPFSIRFVRPAHQRILL